MAKRALVTGVTGQDGSYLAEHLVAAGYEVHGLIRGQSHQNVERVRSLVPDVRLVEGDLLDQGSLIAAIEKTQPEEVYNLAAITFVPLSWRQSEITTDVTGQGVLRMLEAIRVVNGLRSSGSVAQGQIRFYQASSSEMFGKVREMPQNEDTPFHPRSPYGTAKAFGHYITQNYRESFGMFAVSGILFNHESPRRGREFVTRKISRAVAQIEFGLASELRLGNLDSRRDWGFAGDYVQAMHLMLQQDTPRDYVIGTGQTHSVLEFVKTAFEHIGRDWQDYVVVDKAFERPAEVDILCSDPKRAAEELGWRPTVGFEELVKMMVDADLAHTAEQLGSASAAAW